VGGDPAATLDRLADDVNNPPVAQVRHPAEGRTLADGGQDIGDILPDVLGAKAADRRSMFDDLLQRAARPDDVPRQAVHIEIALIADDKQGIGIEHDHALYQIIQSGIDRRLGALQFTGFFDQCNLGLFQAMKLSAQRSQQKQRAAHEQQCTGADSDGLNAPSHERRGFRHADIDDKGIVAQRPHGGQTNSAVNIT